MPLTKIKINVAKIPKDKLFKGAKGTYLDAVLMENRDGTDQYGWDGFISIDTTKEERNQGVRGVIIGNFKYIGQGQGGTNPRPASRPAAKPASASAPASAPVAGDGPPESDDVPF